MNKKWFFLLHMLGIALITGACGAVEDKLRQLLSMFRRDILLNQELPEHSRQRQRKLLAFQIRCLEI